MFVPPSSPVAVPVSHAPCLQALGEGAAKEQVRGLIAEFESVTDPRGTCGVRYRISSLLALVVCAMTPAGHDSSSETVYAVTDLPAEEANAAEIASWARGHWTVENTVHWCRDVTFNEDKSQVRTHNAPAVLAALRDLIRSALKLAGYVNTAAGRRAHTDRPRVLTLYRIT
ncbi:transposase [Streptomyces mirabilis]|uniref:transposase n=1 Tax=Streptomyces mirabilis TaxID=68239 RepID=UPI0036BD0EDD